MVKLLNMDDSEGKKLIGKQAVSVQLTVFLGITGISIMIFSVVALAITAGVYGVNSLTLGGVIDLSDANTIASLKFMQWFTSIGLFILPPVLFAYISDKKWLKYLSLKKHVKLPEMATVIILMLISIPVINWLAALNASMTLPDFLSNVEQWMKDAELQAKQLTEAFLKMNSGMDFIGNLLLIAVIPGIGEELLFRGVLQKLLIRWTGNNHAGIWISALLFSALHAQFFGLIPRMLLGAMFGYLLVWSGSLWYPIIAHFINNGLAVFMAFLSQKGLMPGELETFGTATGDIWYSLLSVVLIITILFGLRSKWYSRAKFI